ncbi:MAG: HNH endonuclease, partial [Leptolyngbyaceae cyanobacterium MO_188.B28]|nr:HNH endonuclease [Leptolyngbyaceae cyanobacterium MO_188.B28]
SSFEKGANVTGISVEQAEKALSNARLNFIVTAALGGAFGFSKVRPPSSTLVKASKTQVREIILSALPRDLAGKYKNLKVKIISERKFVKRFGSVSGEAVTVFRKGKNNELIPEVWFKETGNPMRLHEEAVHITQTVNPRMASKISRITEENLANWKDLSTNTQLRLYRRKIEVEIDAQKQLIEKASGHSAKYIVEVRENLTNLYKRLGQVDEAIQNPNLIKQGKIPWWNPNQPPRLFAKARQPRKHGHWEGTPGNSVWISTLSKVNSITNNEGITFRNSYPVFSKWAKHRIKLDDMTGEAIDFDLADYKLAQRFAKKDPNRWLYRGQPNVSEMRRYRQGKNEWGIQLTWHHHQGGKTMLLVPTDLHGNIPHTGGASISRAGQ